MNNFLNFITNDIEAKKVLISTLPVKTKTNIKNYNEKLESMYSKYDEYKSSVRNYLVAKSRSFSVKDEEKDVTKLTEEITNLEHIKYLLNPSNSYFEKMGFDNLLYEINHYYDFNFNSLNDILNRFIEKFQLAGIFLEADDFDYTCYVHEYMSSFLQVRNKRNGNYDKVSEIFEQIYWINPEIIEHIALNFRKLITSNDKKFNNYIVKLQKEAMEENHIKSYIDCLEKLKSAYIDLNFANRENLGDIIELAKQGKIEIAQYLEDSKIRVSAYSSMIIDQTKLSDKNEMKKIYDSLEKLKVNINEYSDYNEFLPLIDNFKEEYKKLIPVEEKNDSKNKFEPDKGLKDVLAQIEEKENKLEKINKKIFSGRPGFFQFNSENNLKKLKIESVRLAKELTELYKTHDKEYFKAKVLSVLNVSLTVSDLLHLYYSFDYFKKIAIKKVFDISTYDELIKYSENFDLFAMNPTNIILTGVPLFEDTNVARIIMNKYRFNNINLTEDVLDSGSLKVLLNKIEMLLRINKIEESTLTVEKIWFMVQVENIIAKENVIE